MSICRNNSGFLQRQPSQVSQQSDYSRSSLKNGQVPNIMSVNYIRQNFAATPKIKDRRSSEGLFGQSTMVNSNGIISGSPLIQLPLYNEPSFQQNFSQNVSPLPTPIQTTVEQGSPFPKHELRKVTVFSPDLPPLSQCSENTLRRSPLSNQLQARISALSEFQSQQPCIQQLQLLKSTSLPSLQQQFQHHKITETVNLTQTRNKKSKLYAQEPSQHFSTMPAEGSKDYKNIFYNIFVKENQKQLLQSLEKTFEENPLQHTTSLTNVDFKLANSRKQTLKQDIKIGSAQNSIQKKKIRLPPKRPSTNVIVLPSIQEKDLSVGHPESRYSFNIVCDIQVTPDTKNHPTVKDFEPTEVEHQTEIEQSLTVDPITVRNIQIIEMKSEPLNPTSPRRRLLSTVEEQDEKETVVLKPSLAPTQTKDQMIAQEIKELIDTSLPSYQLAPNLKGIIKVKIRQHQRKEFRTRIMKSFRGDNAQLQVSSTPLSND